MFEILINGVLGGVTGFLTNDIAIKMLFKEYFGFGGVIEKEYKSFIENISELIEKDLINHHTLRPEIKSEKVRKVVNEIVKTFLLLEVVKKTDKPLSNYNGFEKTIENLSKFIDENKKTIIENLSKIYLDKPINYYISYEQFEFILSKIDNLFQKNRSELERIIYSNFENKELGSLISQKFFDKVVDNISQIIKEIDFSEFDGDFNNSFNSFLEIIEIDEILEKTSNAINEMKIKDFVNDSSNLSYELIQRGIDILNSNPKLLENVVVNLIDFMKNIDISLKDIIGNDGLDKLREFLYKHLPPMIDKILKEIENDKIDIDKMINNAIDEYLKSSSLGGMVRPFIKNFNINISDMVGVIDKILKFIEEKKEEAPKYATIKLIEFIENNSFKEIINILEEKNIISPKVLVSLIQKNLEVLKNKGINFSDEILNKKIGEIHKVDLNFVKDKLPMIFDVVKQNYIYTNELKKDIDNELQKSIIKIKQMKISNFVDEISFDISLNEKLKPFYNKMDKKVDFDVEQIEFNSKELLMKYQNVKPSKIISKLQNENNYQLFTDKIIELIDNNLENVIKGNVSIVVSKELNKYEPKEIKNLVENFMGKELKPINLLGAVLGAGSGVIYAGLTSGMTTPIIDYLAPLIYGATGSFTNYIAIKMLFKPYEKKWYLPYFSPGVVAKNKKAFAENISNFVKNDILTDNMILEMYDKNEKTIKILLNNMISKNNFESLENLLRLNSDKLSQITFDKIFEMIQNSDELIDRLTVIIKKKKSLFITSEMKYTMFETLITQDFTKEIKNYIIQELSSKKLNDYTPLILDYLDKNIEVLVGKILNYLDISNIKMVILKYEDKYESLIQEWQLKNFISQKQISEMFSDKIIEFLQTKELDSIFEKLKKDYFSEEKIRYMFDGKLQTFVYKNIDFLIEMMIVEAQNRKSQFLEIITDKFFNSYPMVKLFDKQIREMLNDVLDLILFTQLPNYINSKRGFVIGIADEILDKKLELNFHDEQLKVKIKNYLNSSMFKKHLNSLSLAVSNGVLDIDVKSALRLLNIRNLRQLIEIFNPILEENVIFIQSQIKNKQEKIASLSNQLFEVILNDTFKNRSFISLIDGVNIEMEIDFTIDKIRKNEVFINDLKQFFDNFVDNLLESDFYSDEILKDDIRRVILDIDKEQIQNIIKPFLQELINNLNNLVDNNFKKEVLEDVTEAGFETIKIHINDLIKAIDVKEIIKREINEMHPKEIEELFQKFAGDYFSQLIKFGWLGGGFGLLVLIINQFLL